MRLVGYRKAVMSLLKFPLKLLAAFGFVVFWGLCSLFRLCEKLLPKRVPHYAGIEGCTKAAISGDVRAQFALGGYYGRGQFGLPQDYAESAKWYRKAAEQNHGAAQLNLGVYLAEGQGVEKNIVEGMMWIILANHVIAQHSEGWFLHDAAYQAHRRLEAQMTEQQLAEARVMLDSSPLYKELCREVDRSSSQPAPEKPPPAQP
jgi:TPR repeat protein